MNFKPVSKQRHLLRPEFVRFISHALHFEILHEKGCLIEQLGDLSEPEPLLGARYVHDHSEDVHV